MTKKHVGRGRPRLPSVTRPPDDRTAIAVAFVLANIRMIREEKIEFLGVPLSWFDPKDRRQHAITILKRIAADPIGLVDVYNLARVGWRLAFDALCELNVEYEHRQQAKPPALATFAQELSLAAIDPAHHHRFIGGPEKADTFLRDIAITFLVGDVCWKFGLKPKRNPAYRHRLCGCAAVALALAEDAKIVTPADRVQIDESGVEHIWRKWGLMAFRGAKFNAETYPFPNT